MSRTVNEEDSIPFPGILNIAHGFKKLLSVSIGNESDRSETMFLRKPSARRIFEFLEDYIARFGIQLKIPSDPFNSFRSLHFQDFYHKYLIQHIECPFEDHPGFGKIERCYRTLNERTRANHHVVLERT